jgi:hypothetical protein
MELTADSSKKMASEQRASQVHNLKDVMDDPASSHATTACICVLEERVIVNEPSGRINGAIHLLVIDVIW